MVRTLLSRLFQVGCIDLEIPVRNPRSFAADIISPDLINKPRKRSKEGDSKTGARSSASSAAKNGGPSRPTSTAQRRSSQKAATKTPSRDESTSNGAHTEQKGGYSDPTPLGNRGNGSPGGGLRNLLTLNLGRKKQPFTEVQHKMREERRKGSIRGKTEQRKEKANGSPISRETSKATVGTSGNDDIQRGRSRQDAETEGTREAAEDLATLGGEEGEESDMEDLSGWSPFEFGSKTSTLRFETVLITIYYPSSYDPKSKHAGRSKTAAESEAGATQSQEASSSEEKGTRYSNVAWAGRPKRASLAALASYVSQYGPFALPVTPAIFSLLNTTLPALVGPPLADPGDKRLQGAAVFPTIRDAKGKHKGKQAQERKQERQREASGEEGSNHGVFNSLFGPHKSHKGVGVNSQLQKEAKLSKEQGATETEDDGTLPAESVDRVWSGNFDGKRWPVVFFSHGLAGSRLSYSQYCGELASHGVVVVALEHRDGSGLQTMVRSAAVGGKTAEENVKVAKQRQRKAKSAAKQKGTKTEADALKEHAELSSRGDDQKDSKKTIANGDANLEAEENEEDKLGEGDYQRLKAQKYREQILRYREMKHGTRYGAGFGAGSFRARRAKKSGMAPLKATVPYLTFEKFKMRSFAVEPTEEEAGLRQAQISMRIAEIEEAKHIIERLNKGEGYELYMSSTRSMGSKLADRRHYTPPADSFIRDPEKQLGKFKGKLDLDYPLVVGHSFGGCTVVEAQRTMQPPFPAAILLDPWCEPLATENTEPVSRLSSSL